MTPKYQLHIDCWLVTALLGYSRLWSACAHHSRIPAQGAAPPWVMPFFVVESKNQEDSWRYILALNASVQNGHLAHVLLYRCSKQGGEMYPPTGVHVKSRGSGQEWIILSLEMK